MFASRKMEIYDEDQLTEYEKIRQRNIIDNYEFMKSCGKCIFIFTLFLHLGNLLLGSLYIMIIINFPKCYLTWVI